MGQAFLGGPGFEETAAFLETLVPGDIAGLKPGRIRYTQLLNQNGGILDDLMVTRLDGDAQGRLFLVVNAACKDADYAHISSHLPPGITLQPLNDRALIALQGPRAAEVLGSLWPDATELVFMKAMQAKINGIECQISRCGYTGEDGFEISLAAGNAEAFAEMLLADTLVKPIGLGARDTLRLEAGLCLYGHDIDETTSPVEAALTWSIGKRRREQGGFPGAERIQREFAEGPVRILTGFRLEGRAPAREGCEIAGSDGGIAGQVTSGSFAPTIGGPVAMGYVPPALAEPGTAVRILIRGTPHPALVEAMPFVPHRYFRKEKSGTSNG
jgi:aminomethyltransferase